MEKDQSALIDEVIKTRRTVKPDRMSGGKIPDEEMQEILELADWAPTHARTEPWRFVVYGGVQVARFCQSHADLYKTNSEPGTFLQAKYDNLAHIGDLVSHIAVCSMLRVPSHKIPEIEEIAAAASAIQNVLLGATSRGIASFWSTGGMTHHPAFRDFFNLGDEDRIMGILYFGYSRDPVKPGARMIPIDEKIKWIRE